MLRDHVQELLRARQPLPNDNTARRHYDVRYVTAQTTPTTLNEDLDTPDLFTIKHPVHGIGLHGFLPPGATAIVVPLSKASMLAEMTASSDVVNRSKFIFQLNRGSQTTPVATQGLLNDMLVLRAGDVVMFDRPIVEGVAVWCCTVWCGTGERPGYLKTGTDFTQDAQDDADTLRHVARTPIPAPLLRVYTGPQSQPTSLAWVPTALTMFYSNSDMDTAAPTVTPTAPAHFIGGGTTHVTVQFLDDTANTRPIAVVAGESSAYEIWWMNTAGVWVHNDADDFDAAGRGVVSGVAGSEHTIEVYEVDPSLVAIYIRRVGATLFHAIVTCSQRQVR